MSSPKLFTRINNMPVKRKRETKLRKSTNKKVKRTHVCTEESITYADIEPDHIYLPDGKHCINCSTMRSLHARDRNYKFFFNQKGTENDKIVLKRDLKKKCNLFEKKLKKTIRYGPAPPTLPGVAIQYRFIHNPKTSDLILILEASATLCHSRITASYTNSSLLKATGLMYGFQRSRTKQLFRSFMSIREDAKDSTVIHIDVICGLAKGDGKKLFDQFETYIKRERKKYKTVKLITASDVSKRLIKTYTNWGFKLLHFDCSDQCHMSKKLK